MQNANLDDLRIIADEFQDGVAGYPRNEFSVLKDSPIKKVEDLKGKVIATNAMGSAVDIGSRAMLKKHGLEDKRDYTIVEAPFPTMKAMLKEKKADLAPYVPPFNFDPELQADVARAVHQQGRDRRLAVHHLGGAQVLHRQEPRRDGRFHGGHAASSSAGSWTRRTTSEVTQIAGKVTKAPPERFGWLFTKQDYYRNPGHAAEPRRAAVQHQHHA